MVPEPASLPTWKPAAANWPNSAMLALWVVSLMLRVPPVPVAFAE